MPAHRTRASVARRLSETPTKVKNEKSKDKVIDTELGKLSPPKKLRLYIRVPNLKSLTLLEVAPAISMENLKKQIFDEIKDMPRGSIKLFQKDKSMALQELDGKKNLSEYNLASSTVLYVEFDEQRGATTTDTCVVSLGANVASTGGVPNDNTVTTASVNVPSPMHTLTNGSNATTHVNVDGANTNGNAVNLRVSEATNDQRGGSSNQESDGSNDDASTTSDEPVSVRNEPTKLSRIFVTPPSGAALSIDVSGNDSIKDVKRKVQDRSKIPVPSFDLCRTLLNPGRTLSECGIGEGALLRMALKLRDAGATSVKVTYERRTFTVDIHQNDEIEYLKIKLEALTGLMKDRQCLMYRGVELFNNDHTVASYNIENNADIVLSDLLTEFE